MRVANLLLVLLLGCKPTAVPMTKANPAHPDAEPGRLAGPPTALRPGVANDSEDPTAHPMPAPDPKPDPKAELLAAETAAFAKAKPVFDKWCAKCHSEGGKLATAKRREHFDMTKYPFGGHHAMEIGKEIRKALAIAGGKPTMPFDQKGAVKGEELAAIAAWADAFDATHAGAAPGHDHGHEH